MHRLTPRAAIAALEPAISPRLCVLEPARLEPGAAAGRADVASVNGEVGQAANPAARPHPVELLGSNLHVLPVVFLHLPARLAVTGQHRPPQTEPARLQLALFAQPQATGFQLVRQHEGIALLNAHQVNVDVRAGARKAHALKLRVQPPGVESLAVPANHRVRLAQQPVSCADHALLAAPLGPELRAFFAVPLGREAKDAAPVQHLRWTERLIVHPPRIDDGRLGFDVEYQDAHALNPPFPTGTLHRPSGAPPARPRPRARSALAGPDQPRTRWCARVSSRPAQLARPRPPGASGAGQPPAMPCPRSRPPSGAAAARPPRRWTLRGSSEAARRGCASRC